ncbi:hypothetical protein A9R05_15595 [Burkholderia sp. KK1]|nr:hypothetical protein A9R05_15595 [Burkholderia sp. KK1]
MEFISERFSGHESFVCRYGWARKLYDAVIESPEILRHDALATERLGVGRNMVRSVQFWGESMGVIESATDSKGHTVGPVGELLFGENGWDSYLENLESIWLIHWWICTRANIAAWNAVFGDSSFMRFDKVDLIARLTRRGEGSTRTLVASTIEQHCAIFLQSYVRGKDAIDDSLWCPLQDIKLLRMRVLPSGAVQYESTATTPVGLTVRVFASSLVAYVRKHAQGRVSVPLHELLQSQDSPGAVFRLDESSLSDFLLQSESTFNGAIRLVDTSDTQSVVIDEDHMAGITDNFAFLDLVAHA